MFSGNTSSLLNKVIANITPTKVAATPNHQTDNFLFLSDCSSLLFNCVQASLLGAMVRRSKTSLAFFSNLFGAILFGILVINLGLQ